jgi:hypothetical protein
MTYVCYMDDGSFNGFYHDDMHGDNIPKPYIKISEDLFQELLVNHPYIKIDTSKLNPSLETIYGSFDQIFEDIDEPKDDDSSERALTPIELENQELKERITLLEAAMNDMILGGM